MLTLSGLQLLAALAAPTMLTAPVRRLPRWLPAALAIAGWAVLTALVVLSIAAWGIVNPFALQPTSAWSVLAGACYLCAVAWPIALIGTIAGFLRRRPDRPVGAR